MENAFFSFKENSHRLIFIITIQDNIYIIGCHPKLRLVEGLVLEETNAWVAWLSGTGGFGSPG